MKPFIVLVVFKKTSNEQPGLKLWAILQIFTTENTDSGEVICSRARIFQVAKPEHKLWLSSCKIPLTACGTRTPDTLSSAWCYFQSFGCSYVKTCLADWSATLTYQLLQVSSTKTLVSLWSWDRDIFPSVPSWIYWSSISAVQRRIRCTEINCEL